MNDVLISIVVPAYNIASYIEKSVASIAAQSYRKLEIIVVDDGSQDDTSLIVKRLAMQDERIRIITKVNGGVTSARLRGVAEATGEWIGFVDGDDCIEPQMYERLLENALKYQADISHCGYQMVFPKGHVDYYYNTGRVVQHDKQSGLIALLDGSYIEPGLWNKLFHKRLFRSLLKHGKMDTGIKNNEDLLMNYYLFQEARNSIYEDFCPYHYLLRPSSAATSGYSEHKLKDSLKVTKILLDETEGDPKIHAVVKRKYVRMLIGYATMDCGDQGELVALFRSEMRKCLRDGLREILISKDYSTKLKLMALWAGMLPDSYHWVHQVYSKMRGFDRIYSLDK